MKKIRFYLNKNLDKFMTAQFLNEKAAGVDFGKGIVKLHPDLANIVEMDEKQKKLVINKYFDEYYKKHKSDLRERLSLFRRE
ncbi:hypothetical protein KKH35_02150, partial [Patescibacteria group bacterium]|nr:hypothetical protein [Patescibacteria group bacterium]